MPFELKNAGATYQRLMTNIFKPLIGRTVEVYIDDIVVKSKTQSEHAQHLVETFLLMRAYNMKLNSAKCAFGVNTERVVGTSREWNIQSLQFRGRLILQSPTEELLEQAIRLGFLASNNEVEYEAILARLDLALTLATVKLKICSDSQLVIQQIRKEYEAKEERMARYLELVQDNLAKLGEWAVERVPQIENSKADALVEMVATLPIKAVVLLSIYL
uniref:Retrovirus-related Pol polyprotein from transposon 17.6 n=1 Tax=Vitis vinifera TaxID=29760 RepID=A5AYL6_VITVI|nr:hypothetical protein VITISV_024145 [Vitis vinifera]